MESYENDGLRETQIEIQLEVSGENAGKSMVPSLVHMLSPGLAVTMSPFGVFSVTQISSGLKMSKIYERASQALLAMSEYAMIADLGNTSWESLDKDSAIKLLEDLSGEEVPFDGYTDTSASGTRKLTIGEWFQSVRTPVVFEFPWEEVDPYERAICNFDKLGGNS